MADYFEREINFHIKLEMLKSSLLKSPDWNMKAAFNLIDSQRQGEISHFNLYGFLNQHDYDPSDEELIAMVRRIEGSGNGKLDFNEFTMGITPINIKMVDVQFVEDQGKNIARNNQVEA